MLGSVDGWKNLSQESKGAVFGVEFSHLDVEELKTPHCCKRIIRASENKIAHTKGVYATEALLRVIVRKYFDDFLAHKMMGWCRTFDQLYEWSGRVLPKDMTKETAFFRIMICLMLSNVGWKDSIFDQK